MKEKKNFKIKLVPYVLKALRETSGYSIEDVAKKLKTSKEKIEAVERDGAAFTLIQIKKLADIYKRPLAAFFSDYIPELPKLVDYRINRKKRLTTQVYLAERRAQYLSEEIKELSKKRSKIPSFSEKLKADELAKEFKKYLHIKLMKSQNPKATLEHYKKVLDETLAIIIIEYPLKAEDVRAFSILSDISVIVLNEDDKPPIKLFSLFHEVCHLLKKNAGICSSDLEQEKEDIEFYCNNFSAEFLVPSADLKIEVQKFGQINEKSINPLSEIYGVSKQVIMLRLLEFGYIERKKYEAFKKNRGKEIKQKRFGRRNWDKVFLNRIGNLPLQEIRYAYNKQLITFYEASSILGLKTKYAEKLITT